MTSENSSSQAYPSKPGDASPRAAAHQGRYPDGASAYPHRDLLGIGHLQRHEILYLLDEAEQWVALNRQSSKHSDALAGLTIINAFFENSTRTLLSFEIAGKRLGADVVNMHAATSSVKKGETLIDTAITLNAMRADAIVIRHGSSGAVDLIASKVNCPVINAGDGSHEHPTQALLDALALRNALRERDGAKGQGRRKDLSEVQSEDQSEDQSEVQSEAQSEDQSEYQSADNPHNGDLKQNFDQKTETSPPSQWSDFTGLKVVICGDILHSRVARSNILCLMALGAEIRTCAPPALMPADIEAMGAQPFTDFDAALDGADVVMMLRLQTERMEGQFVPSPREYHHLFGLTQERLARAAPGALVMHPGPMNRGVEIDSEVADLLDRSIITRQVEMGVAIRMTALDVLTRRTRGIEGWAGGTNHAGAGEGE